MPENACPLLWEGRVKSPGLLPRAAAWGHVREKSEIKRVIKGPGHWR
nr:MAG TPA: hypothetical protein [Caudoviricetes sp.]DAV78735.1 MAG TPA: hypothetical protein [Caudoviricetes sp.]